MDIWKAMAISLKGAESMHPKDGFVPDEATAAKIGEVAAIAQYGEKTISQERPFRARLYGATWLVIGTLHPEGALGGTAVVKVSKTDGRILFMMHQE
jgi:NTF2 fold immunity protein